MANGSHYICFSELSFPYYNDKEKDQKFRQKLIEAIGKKDVVVIGGSYHCCEEFYNKSPIFRASNGKVDIVYQPKNFIATKQAEVMACPSPQFITNIVSKNGNCCIAICNDIHSEDIKGRLLYVQTKKEYIPIDFLFVPAYHGQPVKGRNECEEFNRDSFICTVFVNDQTQGSCNAIFHNCHAVKLNNVISNRYFEIQIGEVNTDELRKIRSSLATTKEA